jgi:hypothetical protein
MENIIQQYVTAYKEDFARRDEEERYKWEAIGHYKKVWNIEAEDFADMLADAFIEAGNLLAAKMYFPYRMLCKFAEMDPAELRNLFRNLYDETLPLSQRYHDFRTGADKFIRRLTNETPGRTKMLNHYQDLHAVSIYLAFEYPEKYYI